MKYLWLNHREAQDFAYCSGITQPAIRTMLRGIHNLILESAGTLPEHLLHPRITPAAPLDILIFYKLVNSVFSVPQFGSEVETAPIASSDRVVCAEDAIEFANAFEPVRCRNVLLRFLSHASSPFFASDETIDVYFCCRLLGALVPDEQTMDDILSGEIERRNNELLKDPDWFG